MKVRNICFCCPILFNTPAMKAATSSSFRTAEPPCSLDTRAFQRLCVCGGLGSANLTTTASALTRQSFVKGSWRVGDFFTALKLWDLNFFWSIPRTSTMQLLRIQLCPCTCTHACTFSFFKIIFSLGPLVFLGAVWTTWRKFKDISSQSLWS